ncbi:MAG: hypothetical protein AB1631_14755 [Acidobacteriota bacterium]
MRKALSIWLLAAWVSSGVGSPLQNNDRLPEIQQQATTERLTVPKVFHIAGIPGVPRNSRGDLILTSGDLIFQQGKKQRVSVPLTRIKKALFVSGERHYERATYAAAVATFGIGAILITKKHKVDTFILDYTNERGGLMGMVLQTEIKDGSKCREWLSRFGVQVEEPQSGAK